MGLEVIIKPTIQLFPKDNQENEDFFYIYGAEVLSENKGEVEFNKYGNISIKGIMPKLNIGEEYEATITKDSKSNYAGSYDIEKISKEKPETIEEQKEFLKAVLTETQIKNIYNAYNEEDDIVGMIQRNEFDYEKVYGLGEKTYNKLKEKVLSNLDMSEILAFLSKYNIKYNMIAKLVNHYGDPNIVMQKIESNPYILTEVKGVGFIRADQIARKMGYDMESNHRIDACIVHCIQEDNRNGHSWISHRQLLNNAIDYLNISRPIIENRLKDSIAGVMNIDKRYTLETVYYAEMYISERINVMNNNSKKVINTHELNNILDKYCNKNNIKLEDKQRQFFHDWNENPVLALVGGGGTGKSWLQKILIDIADMKDMTYTLLSPTGRGSKVVSEYTKRDAYTIHRRLGIYDDEMSDDELGAIGTDMVIVDEVSMCDIFVMSKLFKSMSSKDIRVLFIGDDFQLPSVGVGNFLYDILNSENVKVSQLTKVFRQDDCGILDVATNVREGISFLNNNSNGRTVFGKDCVFWLVDQSYIKEGVLTNYERTIKKFDQEDVIVLTPTNKGALGTVALNKELQKIANPPSKMKEEIVVGRKDNPTIFRVGDLVMNTVNSYGIDVVGGGSTDIFNGDIGKITNINEEEKIVQIKMDEDIIEVGTNNMLGRFLHSWATTIHKSQGSQYKVVIVVADRSMTYQLNANLLYTAFSRAEDYMLVLTQALTINRAMRKFINMERRSFMQELLGETVYEKYT